MGPNYLMRILIAVDQLFNVFIGGMPDETLSARSYRLGTLGGNKKWKCRQEWVDWLFFLQKDENGNRNHCKWCYEWEMDRMDLPKEYRK